MTKYLQAFSIAAAKYTEGDSNTSMLDYLPLFCASGRMAAVEWEFMLGFLRDQIQRAPILRLPQNWALAAYLVASGSV